MTTRKRVLWAATKAPWPALDGGRLLLWNTLRALRSSVDVTLVAPFFDDPARLDACAERLREVCRPILVPSRLRSAPAAVLQAALRRRPWTLVRHQNAAVRRRIELELARQDFDVVVAEQVQALSQVPLSQMPRNQISQKLPRPEIPPVVLRAQNVESDLWRGQSTLPGLSWPMRRWLRRQSVRLAAEEGLAVRRCAATAALTDQDADLLRRLSGQAASAPGGSVRGESVRGEPARGAYAAPRVDVIPAIVDGELPAGPALEGDPALVLFGSAGWRPNAEGARAFLADAWPGLRKRLPQANLHVFGDLSISEASGDPRVHLHPAPADSATALARGSILMVPLNVASGVRMKILEAWARGVRVVASPAAARGLVAEAGREMQVAESSDQWGEAVVRCVDRAESMVDDARRRLQETYSPEVVARRWIRRFDQPFEEFFEQQARQHR